jgi:hypothetical protein
MDDANGAFEYQLGSVLQEAAGPSEPVDVAAVVSIATTTPGRLSHITRRLRVGLANPAEGGFSVFSALKLVAAGVIVALFAGFLLAGVLTAPQGDDLAPAAVTAPPSPMTTEELLSGMVTEEVEPGVYRVINDGVRDIKYPEGPWGLAGFVVDVTPDGSVWFSANVGSEGLYRLGAEPVFGAVEGFPHYREVAPDGSLWAIGEVSDEPRGIYSFDGEGWTVRATPTDDLHALAVGPDGTVWVAGGDADKYCPDIEADECWGSVLLRLEDDGSLTTIEDWADVYDGDVNTSQLAVSPDGDVWLVGTQRGFGQRPDMLLRFDGEGWEAIPGPEGWNPSGRGRHRYLDFGPDGTPLVKAGPTGGLARFDDPGWTTFTEADGVEPWGKPWGDPTPFTGGLLDVAADGSLWLLGSQTDEACGGVAHYHGTTWTSYLAEHCVHHFAIAPDGSVWLGAGYIGGPNHLYVITTEAVASEEQ